MHRKYYPLATAQKALDVGNRTYFGEKWRTFGHTSDRMKIMVLHTPTGVIYAPLYIHSFQLVQPHTLVEAEKFNIQYTDPLKSTIRRTSSAGTDTARVCGKRMWRSTLG